ncbi:MAG TPA: DUF4019 domain-containing protein [Rhizomicrobium sp.]|nr:DUF4019 domain-containing protein [Rhizomicrobium sp.]
MFGRTLLAALLIFGTVAPSLSQPARRTVSAATPAPDDRARQWLILVDDKNYAQSWNEAGKGFQTRQKADVWAKDAAAKRGPLGAVASRGLKSIDLSRNDTCIIRYDTVFAHKAAAIETVTLTFENGSWAVADYAVN